MAQRDSDLKVSTQIYILMQNSRCVTPAASTGNFSKYLPLGSKICFFNRKKLFFFLFFLFQFLFTAGFRIYLRLWNRLFSSLRSNDSMGRKNVTWYWETMGLHIHEPQWRGVRRMTHFDRYKVFMFPSKRIKNCLQTGDSSKTTKRRHQRKSKKKSRKVSTDRKPLKLAP